MGKPREGCRYKVLPEPDEGSVATLASPAGGRVRIYVNDHCYYCEMLIGGGPLKGEWHPVDHLFYELIEALQSLPTDPDEASRQEYERRRRERH